jgi:hypothetical protein
MPYSRDVETGTASVKRKINTMKNDIITLAAILSAIIASAAFLLSAQSPVSVEALVGYGSVLTLLGVAALEYRITWRGLFGR